MAEKLEKLMTFSANDEKGKIFDSIVLNTAELTAAATYELYGDKGIIEKVEMSGLKDKGAENFDATLSFAASVSGMSIPSTKEEFAMCMDNPTFRSVMNSIVARTLSTMMVKYRCPQLDAITERIRVGIGDSWTGEIVSKALPVAQRGSYGSNNSSVFQEAKTGVTITPVPMVIGKSLDYIRIFAGRYDWAYQIAKVYAGLMFAKYQLAVNAYYNNVAIQSTPFYQANFTNAAYTQLASDIKMFAGVDDVTAYGTLVAWNAVSALATQGGFTTKDEYIRNAFLQKILGVDSMILAQFTNAAAPFTSGNASTLRTIPDNKILLVAGGSDKPVKIVEEDYIRVKEVDANDNNLNRMEYVFTQSFNAGVASANPFGVIGTTAA